MPDVFLKCPTIGELIVDKHRAETKDVKKYYEKVCWQGL
jgi:hypothetical protein